MGQQKVSFAKHTIFYKNFFHKHKEMLEAFIGLEFKNLKVGYDLLEVFYSTYSYYLKDETGQIDLIKENRRDLKQNKRYIEIRQNSLDKGYANIGYKELIEMNKIYNETILDIFTIFEIFCNTFAIDDIMPEITEGQSDYEKKVLFASYETFYDCLFLIHSEINNKLMNFKLSEFSETIKNVMAFYYGYSYYIGKGIQKEIKVLFNKLFNLYNNEEFIKIYFNLLQGKILDADKIISYKEDIQEMLLEIYALINEDLSKKNLMPMKRERILIDDTLI